MRYNASTGLDWKNEEKNNQYLSGRSYGELYAKGLMEPEELEDLSEQSHSSYWLTGFKEAAGYSLMDLFG